jgi:hypothetical protein
MSIFKGKLRKNPELANKTPKEMGVRPYLGIEIKSYVAGLRISIILEHIYEALRLTSTGIILKSTPSSSEIVAPKVQMDLYEKETTAKSNKALTPFNRVIYKIMHESIVPKLGGTDHISVCHKMFVYHVGKGNKIKIGKFIFDHLLDSVNSGKSNVHHCRLLSHMFAQSGLLDAVKPVFPGFGSYLSDPQIINNTTLRYLSLVKADKIVYPDNPLLIRESEDGIGESYLVCVNVEEATKVAREYEKFVNQKFGIEKDLIDKQRNLLGSARKISVKRKAPKEALESRPKKTSKVTSGKRKPKKQRKLVCDETDEDREKAQLDEALAATAAQEAKDKANQEELDKSWESNVEPNKDAHMDSELTPEATTRILANQKIYKALENGKYPDYLVNGLARAIVIDESTFIQPPLVKLKHIFENLFAKIEPPNDSKPKRRCLPQCESLGETFPNGVYSYPKPKSSKPPQISPQPTLTNQLYDFAETCDTHSSHLLENEEETPPQTPRPKNTPPYKYVLFIDQALLNLEPTPEDNQPEPTPQQTPQTPPKTQP